jgi:phage tail sheath protein FI
MLIPELVWLPLTAQRSVFDASHGFCEPRHGFLIVDPPPPREAAVPAPFAQPGPDLTIDDVAPGPGLHDLSVTWGGHFLRATSIAAATYYPWIVILDPWSGSERYVPPSGSLAGIYARVGAAGGVWKAPAGMTATLEGVLRLADTIDDRVTDELAPLGINTLRDLPPYGHVSWGARTLAGGDSIGSDWKYVPVRRFAAYIEHSLDQSMGWAVFEPNDGRLWAAIARQAGAFMADLFAAGALQGATATQAYSVACDGTTTSRNDILRGVVNLRIAFAPIRPREFIVLTITAKAAPPDEG